MFSNLLRSVFITATLVAVPIFASGSHGYGHGHGKAPAKTKHESMSMGSSKRVMLDAKTKKEVISVLEANEQLHASFFQYNGKNVESAAKVLKSKINGLSNAKIKSVLKFSLGKLANITAKNDRKMNNQNYHMVSMALIHIVNSYDVGKKYNTYSCPMVKKKWLQNSAKMAKVSNPYTSKMPHCGSKDTNF